MKKTFTLALTLALAMATFGSADAAPLKLKRPAGKKLPTEVTALAENENSESVLLMSRTSIPAMQQTGLGFFNFQSPSSVMRQRAGRSATAAQRAIAANVDLCAQQHVGSYTTKAFYHLPLTSDGAFTPVANNVAVASEFAYGGYYDPTDNTYNGADATVSNGSLTGSTLYKIDMATGATLTKTSIPSSTAEYLGFAVAYDQTDGKAYGYYYNANITAYVWATVDYFGGSGQTVIADATSFVANTDFAGFICTKDGRFFLLSQDGDLYSINKATGAATLIGATEGLPMQYSGCCYANPNGESMLFCAPYEDLSGTGLFEINLETAAVTLVAEYDLCQMYNMYVTPPAAEDKAPAAPKLSVSAPEGTMTATYTVTLPTTLYDGTPISGSVDWNLKVGDEIVAEGRNAAGTSVSGTVTLAEAGMTTFQAYCFNAEGNSPSATVKLFVGKGLPAASSKVTAAYADGTMAISWNAVTTSADGGYIDPAEVTYNVLKDEELLAENLAETTFSYEFEAPTLRTEYTYTVVANYDGKASAAATSNTVALGAWPTPFSTTFNKSTILTTEGYTVIDANTNSSTWTQYSTTGVRCPASKSKPADDWLITPDVYLEGGKVYKFSCLAYSSSTSYTKTLTVKAGQGKTVADMTLDVVDATNFKVNSANAVTLTGWIKPEVTGNYNIGIHDTSTSTSTATSYTYVKNLSISEGYDPLSPKAVENLTVTPNTTGLLTATVTFTMPTATVLDEELSTTTNYTYNILRNGELVRSATAKAGANVTYAASCDEKGTYEISVLVLNGSVNGLVASQSVYIGPYPAKAPTYATFFETNQKGTVTLVWDAVTLDSKGNTMDPSQVKYQVYGVTEDGYLGDPILDAPTTNVMATFKATDNWDQQKFCQYVVGAYNRDEEPQNFVVSNFSPVGKPYTLPVGYTNDADLDSYILGIDTTGGCTVGVYDTDSFDFPAADADDFFFGFYGTAINKNAEIFTGMLDLTATERPVVEFYTYRVADTDKNQYDVYVIADNAQTHVATFTNADAGVETSEWCKRTAELSAFNGKNVQVVIRGTVKSHTYMFFDNIRVRELPQQDLEVVGIYGPGTVKAGDSFSVTVEVANVGTKATGSFDVNLYRDGDLLETRNCDGLDIEDAINVVFDDLISYFDQNDTEAVYSAEVAYADDEDTSNNTSDDLVVARPATTLPVVNDLTAEATEEGVLLNWSGYDATNVSNKIVTEGFEAYTAGDTEVDGWTFLDLDGDGVYGVEDNNGNTIVIPGLTSDSPMCWTIFDSSLFPEGTYGTQFASCGGDKFMFVSASINTANNDWAISPQLSGNEQVLTFYAKSYASSYPETIAVYGSYEDSEDPDDFEIIKTFKNISGDWTKFSVNIEREMVRFAIVCESSDQFMCFVDDITFESADTEAYTITGYDVYRNGVKIGETDGETTTFTDAEAGLGKHIYHVVAKYAEGDSELSNPAEIEIAQAGIAVVGAKGQATVKVDGRDIVISNADNAAVAISTIDGKLLFTATGDSRFTAAPAFYLVTVNGRAIKVVVR